MENLLIRSSQSQFHAAHRALGFSSLALGLPSKRIDVSNSKKKSSSSIRCSSADFAESGVTSSKPKLWHHVIPLRRTYPLIEPFVTSEFGLIARGWLCTAVAVGALFLSVPEIGVLSNLLGNGDLQQLYPKAIQVLALVLVRSVAQFWQQAFLWEAALKITYKLRRYVYERVLQRDMEYFEGDVPSGDVAFRLTAEAEDVGDTVHSLLHVREPGFGLN